jgi:hypothetical membrane protein
VVSASVAPVALIGGWTVAAARQPAGFSSVRETISALAGLAATDRWIMTVGLAVLGLCHLMTAAGLRPVATPGRALLAIGGAATILVSLLPLPRVGTSMAHGLAAGVGFIVLALWPALAIRRAGPTAPRVLRAAVSGVAALVLAGLVWWFGVTLYVTHVDVGLAERFAAGAQALWPLVAVLTLRGGTGKA